MLQLGGNNRMAMQDAIRQIDAEIAKLQRAKALLSSGVASTPAAPGVKGKRGRPKGSKSAVKAVTVKAPGKRTLSPAGRKAIADAMKRRWGAKKAAK